MTQRYRHRYLVIIATLGLAFSAIILSPIATPALALALELVLPIEITGMTGSLWSRSLHIQKLVITQNNELITIEDITLDGISAGHQAIDSISIDSIQVPNLAALDNQSSRKPSTSPMHRFKSLSINHLKLASLPGLNDLEATNLHIDIHPATKDFTLSTTVFDEDYLISASKSAQNNAYDMRLNNAYGKIDLTAIWSDKQLSLTSTANSDINPISVDYFFEDGALAASITHMSKFTVNLSLSYLPTNSQLVADIREINIPIGHSHLELKGQIDTNTQSYHLDGEFRQSSLKVRTIENKGVAISSSIADLGSLSSFIKGSCELNAYYNGNEWSLYSYSENLALPLVKLNDVQLSFNSQGKQQLYVSATQFRNSAIKVEQPSLKMSQTAQGLVVNMFGLYEQFPQTIQAIINTDEKLKNITLAIHNFTARGSDGTQWSLNQSQPITFSGMKITSGPLLFSSTKDQKLFFNGEYDILKDSWWVENEAKNVNFSINSQGIIDSDTEVIINNITINGNGRASQEKNTPVSLTGYYHFTDLSASFLNIIPDFPFPLDYHIENSSVSWSNGYLSGNLSSKQGNIKVTPGDNKTYIESHEVNFSNQGNKISAELLFIQELDRLTGQVSLHELSLNFDHENAFIPFPKDIRVIGDMPTAKQKSSPIQYNLEIHANNIPAELLGFRGSLTTDLTLFVPTEGAERVTGLMQIQNPKLAILNKLIPLKELSVRYNDQPWRDGTLNIQLQQNTTIHSGKSDTSNAEINLSVAGKIQSPSVEISTNPIHLSKDQSLTQILLSNPSLPKGNENNRLLEFISGMKRNDGVIAMLQTMNNLRPLSLDVTISRNFEATTAMPSFGDLDLLVSKQLYEKMWISYKKPLHDDNYMVTLNLQVKPWLSAVAQYNSDSFFSFNLFYNQ